MKKLLLIISFCIPFILTAKRNMDSIIEVLDKNFETQSATIEQQKHILDSLSREFQYLKRESDFSIKTNEQTISSITNQIGSTSNSLTIFGMLFGIGAIVLGVYVTYIERKVVRLNEKGQDQLSQSEKIKSEVNEINDLIQNDISGLFEKIKRVETKHMLYRLIKVPGDIGNLRDALLSRELERDDFELLKSAYSKLLSDGDESLGGGSTGMNYKDLYLLAFYQHFLDLAIKDSEIGPIMTDFYETGIKCSFENDIIKSLENFMKAIIDLGIQSKSTDIKNYFNGLAKSKYVDLNRVYEVLFSNIPTRGQRFSFYQQLPNTEDCKKVKIHFGKMLMSNYSDGAYTDSEQNIIDEVNELKNQ